MLTNTIKVWNKNGLAAVSTSTISTVLACDIFVKTITYNHVYSKTIEKAQIKKLLNTAFQNNLYIDGEIVDKLFTKRVNKLLISKFIEVLIKINQNKVAYKTKPIKVNKSLKILEIQILKDWRIYLIKKGNINYICGIGHKNTQNKDIRKLINRFSGGIEPLISSL